MADIDQRLDNEEKLILLLLLLWRSQAIPWWFNAPPSMKLFEQKIKQSGVPGLVNQITTKQLNLFLDEVGWQGDRSEFYRRLRLVNDSVLSNMARKMADRHASWQIDPASRLAQEVVPEWEIRRDVITDLSGVASKVELGTREYLANRHQIVVETYWKLDPLSNWCDTCLSLANTHQSIWSRQFPGGPPAHPNCRCYLGHHRVLSSVDWTSPMGLAGLAASRR
jgi:hypothetical protein